MVPGSKICPCCWGWHSLSCPRLCRLCLAPALPCTRQGCPAGLCHLGELCLLLWLTSGNEMEKQVELKLLNSTRTQRCCSLLPPAIPDTAGTESMATIISHDSDEEN